MWIKGLLIRGSLVQVQQGELPPQQIEIQFVAVFYWGVLKELIALYINFLNIFYSRI